jgi:hypothetical protein
MVVQLDNTASDFGILCAKAVWSVAFDHRVDTRVLALIGVVAGVRFGDAVAFEEVNGVYSGYWKLGGCGEFDERLPVSV